MLQLAFLPLEPIQVPLSYIFMTGACKKSRASWIAASEPECESESFSASVPERSPRR